VSEWPDWERLVWVQVTEAEFAAMQRVTEPAGPLLGIPVRVSRYGRPGHVVLLYERPKYGDMDAAIEALDFGGAA
jgi:hypothetical protein